MIRIATVLYPTYHPTTLLAFLVLLTSAARVESQVPEANYDEAKVNVENLPSILTGSDGKAITSAEQWPDHRNFLVDLMAENVYGHTPKDAVTVTSRMVNESQLRDSAIKYREIDVKLERGGKSCTLQLLVFMPADSSSIRGCFLLPNFTGNHGLTDDPNIRISPAWSQQAVQKSTATETTTPALRGDQIRRNPIELITARGYVLGTVFYGDIDPDFDDGFENGVHALFPEFKPSETQTNRWGSIAAWAWGLSRCADVLLKQPEIQLDRLAVIGHSRLGKAALWAGATDARFSIVISNDSGCGGAALSRRNFGETVWRINSAFPHWFCSNFKKYNQDPSRLPVDQHMLIASIAPRAVYIGSASEDRWADPLGEYTSGYLASTAFKLLGKKGLAIATPPEIGESVGDSVGYHIRQGKHDLIREDWEHYLAFADRHWR